MKFDSYIVSETRTAFSVPLTQEIPIKKSFKQKAFTLAETLITLSIIGVIAAMTVPTLMTNINNQQHITALKKAYSNLSNAIKLFPMEIGCGTDFECAYNTSANFDSEIFMNNLSKQFKTIQYTKINNTQSSQKTNQFQTTDGITYSYWDGGYCKLGIIVDTNSDTKGPNIFGKDKHIFVIADIPQKGFNAGTLFPLGSKSLNTYSYNYYTSWDTINDWSSEAQRETIPTKAYLTGKVLETGKIDEADYK
ncbi:type II secretion system protein [bacterium]|nr:type II secretion system protein [bacterium]